MTPEEIAILFCFSPERLLENKEIQIPRPLILKYLSQTTNINWVKNILKRPEIQDYYVEAVSTFFNNFTYNFIMQQIYVDKNTYRSAGLKLGLNIKILLKNGITLDFELIRIGFNKARFDNCTDVGHQILNMVSQQCSEPIPQDLLEKVNSFK